MIRILISLAAILWAGVCMAGDIVTVKGEAVYYDDGTKSKMECMRLAAEQARIDALARNFGTIVSQDILQSDRQIGNRAQSDFLAVSSTEVKGEWIADDGEPEYEFDYDRDQNLIVKCRIKGKAREISNDSAEFEAMVLKNGTDKKNADILFRDGDDMYLYFRGVENGSLAVFLEDEQGDVYLLLPYPQDSRMRLPVVRDKEYVFFSREYDRDRSQTGAEVEEMYLTAPDHVEYNRLYAVYSPNTFSRPVMAEGAGLPVMKIGEFNKWLIKTRRNDPRMGVKAMNLQILPR